MGACGLSVSLFSDSDGTGKRESVEAMSLCGDTAARAAGRDRASASSWIVAETSNFQLGGIACFVTFRLGQGALKIWSRGGIANCHKAAALSGLLLPED